jgi:hypothetical protein
LQEISLLNERLCQRDEVGFKEKYESLVAQVEPFREQGRWDVTNYCKDLSKLLLHLVFMDFVK